MRCVVTGGAGFIGCNVARALLERGDDVIVLDDLSTGRRENLEGLDELASAGSGRYRFVEGDIRDAALIAELVSGRDVVFHQAAIPSVARSVEKPLACHEVNVDGTLKLLLAARDAGVGRFVLASSSSVYGESPELPKHEEMPSDPLSPYALDKLAAETYARLFKRLYDLNTVSLRYFNVFGPRQDPASDYAAVIPKFVTMIASGVAPTVHGDGEQTRDFTFIDNVVQANLLAASAPESACGEAYNVACGARISLLELIDKINSLLHADIRPTHGPERPGDIRHSLADVGKARRALGYEPAIAFDEGLARTVRWFAPRQAPV